MRVDIHNHFYPAAYLALLEERGRGVCVRTDLQGRRYLEEAGTRLATLTPPMTDLERRFEMMDAVGIDVQVLSLTAPNVYAFTADDAILAARLVNDEYARIRAAHARRLRCLASVPLGTGAEVEELDRAILQLGLDGVVVGTNVAGRALDDPGFDPFWRRVDELRCPVLIHPMTPMVGTRHMEDHALVPMVGFPFDTTLAVARLIWTGFLDRHPHLRLIVLHAGGALPYLAGRLEIGADAYAECRQVERRPTWYLGRLFYDTVSYHPPALRLLADLVGVGRMVLGTDYPHVIGDPARVIASLAQAGFSPEDLERICWMNARDGLGITLEPPGDA
ncbi:MAG TPA: amidohydrolase family protein [Candidatus Dormibacteraeota bacterium]|nr:amidohydrolase family protein [Candidatus Dormibacteraeota bacterium]